MVSQQTQYEINNDYWPKAVTINQTADLINHYAQIPWQWMATLDLEPGTTQEKAERLLKWWRKSIYGYHKLQIAHEGIFNAQGNTGRHLHLLMLGRSANGRSLLHIPDPEVRELEHTWQKMAHRSASIEWVYDLLGAVRYVYGNNVTNNPAWQQLCAYNKRLLKKARTRARFFN